VTGRNVACWCFRFSTLGAALAAEGNAGSSPPLLWNRVAVGLIQKHRVNSVRASRILAATHHAVLQSQVPDIEADSGGRAIAAHRLGSSAVAALFPSESGSRFEALAIGAVLTNWSAPSLSSVQGGDSGVPDLVVWDKADRLWPLRRPVHSPGRWEPTPPIFSFNPLEPLAGEWKTWVLRDGAEVEPPPPLPYDSPQFNAELLEVWNVARNLTPEQKAIAEKWNLDLGTVTPSGVWNLIALDLAEEAGLDEATTIRMMATLNVAIADAFIACWHAKYKWWTVRPITVIRQRYDPEFLSHLLTPSFPSYPSGHASASGAAEVVLAQFFPRKAEWLRAQAEEAAMLRLYGGIHFRSDNDAGLALGRQVGRLALERYPDAVRD
jgi:membrane-associated phospholipid phosphatase